MAIAPAARIAAAAASRRRLLMPCTLLRRDSIEERLGDISVVSGWNTGPCLAGGTAVAVAQARGVSKRRFYVSQVHEVPRLTDRRRGGSLCSCRRPDPRAPAAAPSPGSPRPHPDQCAAPGPPRGPAGAARCRPRLGRRALGG